MGLQNRLLKEMHRNGITKPISVQQRAIAPIISGRDVIVVSPAGSGKTVCWVIALLTRTDPNVRGYQSLVLLPSRQLTWKAEELVRNLGNYLPLECYAVTGGNMSRDEAQALEYSGAHIVMGSAGHIFNMLRRRDLDPKETRMLVIDGGDGLETQGQTHLITDVLHYMPPGIQVVLLCRTLTAQLQEVMNRIMSHALVVDLT